MNIAAGETGRDNALWEKPVNPQTLVHKFGALYCCTTMSERRKEKLLDFFSPSTKIPTILWERKLAACSARFLFFCCFDSSFYFFEIWCLDLVLHYKPEYMGLYLEGKILKVTLLSTF